MELFRDYRAQWVYLPLGPMALFLRDRQDRNKPDNSAPREVIVKAWRRYVVQKKGCVDIRAYTFCVLSHLQTAIHRRDVFTRPSWRYADPLANLLSDCRVGSDTPDRLPHAWTAARCLE